MSTRVSILFPVGRLVGGSVYEPQKTDAVIKSGPNAGMPAIKYYFACAIPKRSETHWNQTEWGTQIYSVGVNAFPNGQTNSPTFAWKIVDGDSRIPNENQRVPCEREGYAGHWILNFSSAQAPKIVNSDGTKHILEVSAVNLGDYIQVYGDVVDNIKSSPKAGVYLNHRIVALSGYGERIILGPDPASLGFGKTGLPIGASATPIAQGFNPTISNVVPPQPQVTMPPTQPPITPYPQILTPPPSVPVPPVIKPARVMLPSAQGATYEQLCQAGWTDELLIQHGMMQA